MDKEFENRGICYVQIFCPVSESGAISKGRKLAEVARDTFRGQTIAERGLVSKCKNYRNANRARLVCVHRSS